MTQAQKPPAQGAKGKPSKASGIQLQILHWERDYRLALLDRALTERTDLTAPKCRHITAWQLGPCVRLYGCRAAGLSGAPYVEIPFTRFQYWAPLAAEVGAEHE